MEKIIYVIHRYEKGEALSPLGFHDASKAQMKFNELSIALHGRAEREEDIDQWQEIGGSEITCMGEDTIYRLCLHNIVNEETDRYAYTEFEDGKYYQLRDVGVSTYGQCRRYLKGFVEEYGRDENLELVDSAVDYAKFESDGKEYIHEAYVQEIEFVD